MCCLLYQRASLHYKQGCQACFTEKQCDVSIRMPLQQSVAVFPKGSRTELNNTFPNLLALSLTRNAYFPPVDADLPSRLIHSLSLPIQPLDFIFYKIQSMLNIMMTVDSLFLPKAAPPFHLSALEATFIKTSNPALC